MGGERGGLRWSWAGARAGDGAGKSRGIQTSLGCTDGKLTDRDAKSEIVRNYSKKESSSEREDSRMKPSLLSKLPSFL